MRPQVPDGYVVDYTYGTTLCKRLLLTDTALRETMLVTAHLYAADAGQGNPRYFASASGQAILHPLERFSLRVGQDVALGRALKALATSPVAPPAGVISAPEDVSYEERKALLEQYVETHGGIPASGA